MKKRLLALIVVSGASFFTYQWITAPQPLDPQPGKKSQASTKPGKASAAASSPASSQAGPAIAPAAAGGSTPQAAAIPPISMPPTGSPVPGSPSRPMPRIEDFDPAKAMASGIWYHPDLPEDQVRAKMVEYLSNKAMAEKRRAENWARENNQPIREELPGGGVRELMSLEPDGRPVYFATENVQSALSLQTDLVRNTSPYAVNGTNGKTALNIGVWDGGSVRGTHKSLTGRVTQKESGISQSDHATHVSGTLIGGAIYPALMGMAPSAAVLSYDSANDIAEMTAEAQTTAALGSKILVSNHSYGVVGGWAGSQYQGTWPEREDRNFGMYDSRAVAFDTVCFNSPYYLPFASAGNYRIKFAPAVGATFQRFVRTASGTFMQNHTEVYNSATHPANNHQNSGGYDTVTTNKCAKNIMSVGAVNEAVDAAGNRSLAAATSADFSGWGPTDDGRIKPDIVAVGVNVLSATSAGDDRQTTMNGTSMASPSACGSALLLQELYADNFSGVAMRASTLKALILHTADDLGTAGPDYSFGWGLMNTKKAADLILAHKNGPAHNQMTEDALTTAQASKSYNFSWNGDGPIRVTICWTDPAGTAQGGLDNSAANLVNDLDLRVAGPGGTTMPYTLNPASPATSAATGDNVRDNVEQVYIAAPVAGNYTVTVNHKGTLTGVNGRQNFSLIHNGLRAEAPVIRLSTKLLTFSTSPSSSPDFYSFTLQNTGPGTLNYSISDNASWLHVNPTSGSATNGETDTIFLGFTTTTLVSGVYTARVYVTAPNAAPAELEVRLTVTGNTVPLAQALDTTETISSSGSAPWFGQTALAHDSADAARSAPVKDNLDTAFSMTVQGPGELKFWWKVHSDTFDKLKFEIGTAVNQEISGNQDWAQVTVPIAAGSQKLTWRYKKDSSNSVGADAGWVDEVRYVPYTANLELTQTKLDLITTLGVNPPGTSFNILNEGVGTIEYTVSSSKSWIAVSPTTGSTAGEPDLIGLTFNVAGLKVGLNSARVTVQPKNGVAQYCDVNLNILPTTGIPLHTAVDWGTATSWMSIPAGTNASWFGQVAGAYDKTDCVRSGTDLPDNGQSILSLSTLPGPCTVSFYWRTDSEAGYDKLAFFDGAMEVASISGQDPVWKQFTFTVGSGNHNICWKYTKDSSQSRGLDCGFVDKVVLDFKAPKLQVSTSMLVGSGIAGGTPGGPLFQVSNVGGGTLNYAITADHAWCKPSVAKGTAGTETDSINVSFDARSLSAGTHYTNINVNGGTGGSHNIRVQLDLGGSSATAVTIPTGKAYLQAFAKPTLPSAVDGWGFYSSDEGRIAIVAGALRMDDKVAGSLYSLNEAVLHANLVGKTGVYLTFSHRRSNDETHLLPDSFTGHANGDGVSISEDGITWHTVDQLLNTDGNFTNRVVNLDAAVAAAGLTYNADFQIKFQQYDDCSWGTDGMEFDAIFLAAVAPVDDHRDDFSAATVISPGSSTNGKLEVAGDQDMFSFTLAQPCAFTVLTTGATDTYGELYDSSGNLMLSNNDGVGKNFLISRTMDPGTYYISVRGFNGAKGLYTLVTNSRVNTAVPSLALPTDDWPMPVFTPFNPTAENVPYSVEMRGLLKQGHGETLVVLGSLKVKVNPNRSYTGSVIWEGSSWPVTGAFAISDAGISTGTVVRKGLSTLNFMLRYHHEGSLHSEWRLLGTVTDGVTTANADLLEDYNWNAKATNWDGRSYMGTYTIAMPAVSNGSTLEPQGMAYGILNVTATGDATLQLTLPDTAIMAAAVPLTNSEHAGVPKISFYSPQGNGFIAGELSFRDLAGVSDLDGRVSWRKPAEAKNKFYPSGFHINRRILGSKFAPVANAPDLQLKPNVSSALAKFFGSDLPYIPGGVRLVGWSIQDKLTSQFTNETWTYTVTNGVVKGTFKHAATATSSNFGGVILQKQRSVGGFFQGTTQTGLFYMEGDVPPP